MLGKTQCNAQLAHWATEYTSQACYMCQLGDEFEPSTLIHTLYECPKAQRTMQYICKEFTLQENIKAHEIIIINAKCTSNLGKHPCGDNIHNECGVLNNYNENSPALDYIWSVMCQYFIDCHSKQIIIQPKTALNLILI